MKKGNLSRKKLYCLFLATMLIFSGLLTGCSKKVVKVETKEIECQISKLGGSKSNFISQIDIYSLQASSNPTAIYCKVGGSTSRSSTSRSSTSKSSTNKSSTNKSSTNKSSTSKSSTSKSSTSKSSTSVNTISPAKKYNSKVSKNYGYSTDKSFSNINVLSSGYRHNYFGNYNSFYNTPFYSPYGFYGSGYNMFNMSYGHMLYNQYGLYSNLDDVVYLKYDGIELNDSKIIDYNKCAGNVGKM